MRIAVDISPAVHQRAGIGRYTYELISALSTFDSTNTYQGIYNDAHGAIQLASPLSQLPTFPIRLSARALRFKIMLAYLAHRAVDEWLPVTDIFHATAHLLPPLKKAKTVFTLHDLTVQLYPEHHLPLNRWYSKLMLPLFLRHAHAIIAVSENTRRDALHWLPELAPKIQVIYPGLGARFQPIANQEALARVRARYSLPRHFILYVGTLEPRKNLLTLLTAYRALLDRQTGTPPLVLTGRKGWLYEAIFRHIQQLGLEPFLYFTDWVADEDMPLLINAAHVFVYPSIYEGFGFPPLEAMACGTPLVCSNAASLPEVVGSGGLLIDPMDIPGWIEALHRVLSDDVFSLELRAQGLAQAKKFSWERTAQETRAIYQSLKPHDI